MIPISKAVLKEELNLAQRILTKWQQKIDEGIPGQDIPSHEDMAEFWNQEMISELFLVSKKLESIAEIVAQNQIG